MGSLKTLSMSILLVDSVEIKVTAPAIFFQKTPYLRQLRILDPMKKKMASDNSSRTLKRKCLYSYRD